MNRALESDPLSVARRRLYRSGQRLDPLVGSAPRMLTHRCHGVREGRILFGCRAGALTELVNFAPPSWQRWSIHYPPALKDLLDPRGSRPARKNHKFSSRGFPDWRADRMQRLDSMRKLS